MFEYQVFYQNASTKWLREMTTHYVFLANAISLYTSLILSVDLNYIHSSVAMHLSEMDCRVAALLAMTSVRIRHCERSAAIHLTQAKQNGFSRLQGYAKTLGLLRDTRLVYNDMAFAGMTQGGLGALRTLKARKTRVVASSNSHD